jgi:hypothetical protein
MVLLVAEILVLVVVVAAAFIFNKNEKLYVSTGSKNLSTDTASGNERQGSECICACCIGFYIADREPTKCEVRKSLIEHRQSIIIV